MCYSEDTYHYVNSKARMRTFQLNHICQDKSLEPTSHMRLQRISKLLQPTHDFFLILSAGLAVHQGLLHHVSQATTIWHRS